ncbi:hypothetical protein GLOIN_2v1765587 [Rhizophagus clarus]|uniref:Uncharacterized protein n=1 Tax=Rhizophagus clarus TaxID=94130 RepID=A0A8H3QRS8_9GLOM|nr:hypothetical protein GLOIN_2v1765587 [Rhizophagus clarus]
MSNVHTLNDIKDREGGSYKKPGHRLGSVYEQELEKKIRSVTEFNSEINDLSKKLVDKYNEREKEFENKASQLIASTTKVRSQLISERKSHSESQRELKAKYSAEVKLLKSQIKTLKREGTLAQKASFADKIKIISLEVKVRELESKLEDLKPDPLFHNSVGETIEDLTQIDPKVIDSLRLELERVKEDLNSKEYEIECMEKGKESSDSVYKREIDDLYSAQSELREANRSLKDQLALKKEPRGASHNEVDTPLPPINNSSQLSTLNPSSQIISVGGAEVYLLRLYGSWLGNSGIRGKKATDISLTKNTKIGRV